MRRRETILKEIQARGTQMEHALKVQMALQGIEERAANRPTLRKDTKVFVDFARGWRIDDDDRVVQQIIRKITVSFSPQGLYVERGDAPRTRLGKAIKHNQRRKRPLFSVVLPIYVERFKELITELYGEQISKQLLIYLPGVYHSQKQLVEIEGKMLVLDGVTYKKYKRGL